MATKKYINLENLSVFLDGLKDKFAALTHTHTVSEITDYAVDDSLSDTSVNPVQNKVLNAEFDAVATAMNALEASIDNKVDANHNHDDVYETKTDAQAKYDEITNAKEDWNQNDETALDYIKNRTHWVEQETEVVVPATTETDGIEILDGQLFSGTYVVTVDGTKYTCETYHNTDSEPFLGDSRLFNSDDMSNPVNVPFYVASGWEGMGIGDDVAAAYVIYPDAETHTIEIAKLTGNTTYHPLDENFIPDTIARVSDISDIGSSVESVNGKTGSVELTYSDVGAAPDGYGLGGTSGAAPNNDADQAVNSGWYTVYASTANGAGIDGALFVERNSWGICQTTTNINDGRFYKRYKKESGTWSAWVDCSPSAFAPAGLSSTSVSAATEDEITARMNEVYGSIGDSKAKIFYLSITEAGLSLSGGGWFVTVYRTTSQYGYAEAVNYSGTNGQKFTNVMMAGSWGGWKNASPSTFALASHTHTAAQVGAAPAGYGLGTSGTLITDWNSVTTNGFVKEEIGTEDGHSPFIGKGSWGYVTAYSSGAVTQVAFCGVTAGWTPGMSQKIRVYSDGAWREWEWVNPPMDSGIEYRTTERIDGKAVYKRKDSDGEIRYRLDGSNVWSHSSSWQQSYKYLNAAGWYKIGSSTTEKLSVFLMEQWAHSHPTHYSFDILLNYNKVKIVNKEFLAYSTPTQFTKIALKIDTNGTYSIYMYYAVDQPNTPYIYVNGFGGTVTFSDFEAATIDESEMTLVETLAEWNNPPMVTGNQYRTTERLNNKAVYKMLDSSGKLLYKLDGSDTWSDYHTLMGAAPTVHTHTDLMKRGTYERIEGTSSAHKNLNNYTTAGFYNVKTAYTDNCPSGIGIDAVLLVYGWDTSGYECQEITESAASPYARRWIRHNNGGTWSAWKAIISEDNYKSYMTTYSLSKTGSNIVLTGSDGSTSSVTDTSSSGSSVGMTREFNSGIINTNTYTYSGGNASLIYVVNVFYNNSAGILCSLPITIDWSSLIVADSPTIASSLRFPIMDTSYYLCCTRNSSGHPTFKILNKDGQTSAASVSINRVCGYY